MVLFPLALVLTAFEPSLLHVSPLQGTTGDPASLHVIDGFAARRNGRPTADDSNLFPANGHGGHPLHLHGRDLFASPARRVPGIVPPRASATCPPAR